MNRAADPPLPSASPPASGGRAVARAVVLGLSLLLAVAVIAVVKSQTPATATVALSPEEPSTVGDLVTITVTVTHDSETRVVLQPALTPMGEMDPAVPEMVAASPNETILAYQTRAFRSGRFVIELPEIPLERDGQRLESIAIEPILVTVDSVLSPSTQPRPLTPPDLLEAQDRNFAPWIVALIGIALGFVLARLLRMRRRSQRSSDTLSETVVGSSSLPEFDPSLPAAEQCHRLATAVRARLAEEWSLPARSLTSAELPRALALAGAPAATVQQVRNLLAECDRVQYAGREPAAERLRGYHELAATIIAEAR